jgi:subtilisin family serine protease
MKKLLLVYALLQSVIGVAQEEDAWVYFKDKPQSATFLANPTTMLTQRSLDRRTKQKIALDEKDVPVDANYYNQLKNVSGLTLVAKSRWLNAVHVRGTKAVIDGVKTSLNFVQSIEFANKSLNKPGGKSRTVKHVKRPNKFSEIQVDFDYGIANTQVSMIKANFLHKEGFTGEGVHMAVIDAGFPNVNTLAGFKRLRDANKILGGYDFVNRSNNFYTGHSHGTHVLSDIAGYVDKSFVGTAPDASFYLFITEDIANEGPHEESLWVEAAERADSLGVDVINTSLGYTEFDNTAYNHTYSDMDGKTAFISRGAEIGVSRGMILVTSAGNDGNKRWKYVSAPADAKSVFTIGAVSASKSIASFSSFGPTADNRVKPDVLAHGLSVYVLDYISGNTRTINGTSFSSPIMAGAVACMWQAFPNRTNMEIMDIIRKSADRYTNPTAQYGYGIPDLEKAYKTTLGVTSVQDRDALLVYPNPVTTQLFVKSKQVNVDYSIRNVLGALVQKGVLKNESIGIEELQTGVYILELTSKNNTQSIRFVKE